MIEAIFTLLSVAALIYLAFRCVLNAYRHPRGAYLRIVLWTVAGLAGAFLLVGALSLFASDAAGLGLVFIFLKLIAMVAAVAVLALVATSLRRLLDALR